MSKPVIIVVAAVIERAGTFLVTRRPAGVHLEGYWEFPGGKCLPGETDLETLRRELREELDAAIDRPELLSECAHEYSDRVVELRFYRCDLVGAATPTLGQELRWATRSELSSLRFPPADAELIARLGTEPAN